MRRLNAHAVPGAPLPVQVFAVDNPGMGDPNLRYEFAGFNTVYNGAALAQGGYPAQFTTLQLFFNDDYQTSQQPNGVTENAVITAIIDHLAGKQTGPRACQENAVAMEYLRAAAQLIDQRDLKRAVQPTPVYQTGGYALAS